MSTTWSEYLKRTIQNAKTPALACETINRQLAATGSDVRIEPTPSPMDARALVALCKEHNLADLASDLIGAGRTEVQVRERLALAGRLRSRMDAAGASDFFRDTLDALLRSPVDAVCHAFMVRMEEGEPQIRSDHQATAGGTAEVLTPASEVMAVRKKPTAAEALLRSR